VGITWAAVAKSVLTTDVCARYQASFSKYTRQNDVHVLDLLTCNCPLQSANGKGIKLQTSDTVTSPETYNQCSEGLFMFKLHESFNLCFIMRHAFAFILRAIPYQAMSTTR